MPYNKNDICRACTRHMKFLLYDSAKHVHREIFDFEMHCEEERCEARTMPCEEEQCEARTSRKSKIFEMHCEEERCEARTMPCEEEQCEARTSRKSKIFEMHCEEEQCEARTMPCERAVRSTPIEKIEKEAIK